MDCQACRSNLTALLDEELDSEESNQVQQHVALCASCAAELRSLAEVGWLVSQAIPRLEVPDRTWDAVAATIRPSRVAQTVSPSRPGLLDLLLGQPRRAFAVGLASVFFFVASALVVWQYSSESNSRIEREFRAMIEQMDRQEQRPHGLMFPAARERASNPFAVPRDVRFDPIPLQAADPGLSDSSPEKPVLRVETPTLDSDASETRETR